MRSRVFLLVMVLAVSAMVSSSGDTRANGVVVLFTDYGADSIYVGAIKGSILTKSAAVRIETLTNSVPSFDVLAGAYLLLEGCGEFPAGTTFCCVVDPGVGSGRKAIVIETRSGHRFVGPDNGLLSFVAERLGVVEVREASNRELWREGEVSNTFQGRDIFGPVAASLASGVAMSEVGPVLAAWEKMPFEESVVDGHMVKGAVVRADDYGNLVTNITREDLARAGFARHDRVRVRIGDAEFDAPVESTYGDVAEGGHVVVVQSVGYVECAINKGSLASAIGEGLHARVVIARAVDVP